MHLKELKKYFLNRKAHLTMHNLAFIVAAIHNEYLSKMSNRKYVKPIGLVVNTNASRPNAPAVLYLI